LLFDEKLCENGRNFCNKIWNASRLIQGWEGDPDIPVLPIQELAMQSFIHKWNKCRTEINSAITEYKLSEAITALYSFVWDDFCSWYLEMIKPEKGKGIALKVLDQTISYFEEILSALHPFLPFITEDLWHQLKLRATGDDCIISPYPGSNTYNESKIGVIISLQELIRSIREVRNKNGLSMKESIELKIFSSDESKSIFSNPAHVDFVSKFCNLGSLEFVDQEIPQSVSFISGTTKYFIPIANQLDPVEEKIRLQKEREYAQGFIDSIKKKLENERFIQNAKSDVIESERKKLADGMERLQNIEASLSQFL
jgi:valyl-tRNA synthetase